MLTCQLSFSMNMKCKMPDSIDANDFIAWLLLLIDLKARRLSTKLRLYRHSKSHTISCREQCMQTPMSCDHEHKCGPSDSKFEASARAIEPMYRTSKKSQFCSAALVALVDKTMVTAVHRSCHQVHAHKLKLHLIACTKRKQAGQLKLVLIHYFNVEITAVHD